MALNKSDQAWSSGPGLFQVAQTEISDSGNSGSFKGQPRRDRSRSAAVITQAREADSRQGCTYKAVLRHAGLTGLRCSLW